MYGIHFGYLSLKIVGVTPEPSFLGIGRIKSGQKSQLLQTLDLSFIETHEPQCIAALQNRRIRADGCENHPNQ